MTILLLAKLTSILIAIVPPTEAISLYRKVAVHSIRLQTLETRAAINPFHCTSLCDRLRTRRTICYGTTFDAATRTCALKEILRSQPLSGPTEIVTMNDQELGKAEM